MIDTTLPLSLIPEPSTTPSPKRSQRREDVSPPPPPRKSKNKETPPPLPPPPPPLPEEEEDVVDDPMKEEEEDVITIVETPIPITANLLERNKTLKELKDMCTEKGLSNVGKKAELAKRLAEA